MIRLDEAEMAQDHTEYHAHGIGECRGGKEEEMPGILNDRYLGQRSVARTLRRFGSSFPHLSLHCQYGLAPAAGGSNIHNPTQHCNVEADPKTALGKEEKDHCIIKIWAFEQSL